MDWSKILFLTVVFMGFPILWLGWQFCKWVARPAEPKPPINHVLGRVLPWPDDPLWITNTQHPSNVMYAHWKSGDENRIEISWSVYDIARIGFKGYPYMMTAPNKKEQRQLDRYAEAVIENMRTKVQLKLNLERQAVLNKWPASND